MRNNCRSRVLSQSEAEEEFEIEADDADVITTQDGHAATKCAQSSHTMFDQGSGSVAQEADVE